MMKELLMSVMSAAAMVASALEIEVRPLSKS